LTHPADPTVRAATPEDFEGWCALHEAVAGEGRWIGAELPLDRDSQHAHFDEVLADPASAYFLATEAALVVGYIRVRVASYGVADIGMAVAADSRGQGVGGALLTTAVDWAREHGAHKVALQLWPHNTAAQALYEKFGFVVEGRLRRHYPRRNGELWDAIIMGLPLTTP
jgi:ribosomal protein S18 acetylase RimI-like enzyme